MARLYEYADGVAILDGADRVVAKFAKWVTGDKGSLAVATDVATAAPTGTSSTNLVMAGCGIVLTPTRTGTVHVHFDGDCKTGTDGDGGKLQIAYKLGTTAPANGATAAGTLVGKPSNMLATTAASAKYPFAKGATISGLTVGASYWFDLQFAAVTGGTFTLANVNASVFEIGS